MAIPVAIIIMPLLFTTGLTLWRRASGGLSDPANASGTFGDVQHRAQNHVFTCQS